jgi:hypothetical protein
MTAMGFRRRGSSAVTQALETRRRDADMIGTGNFFRDGSKAGGFKALQREAIRMDARSNFKAGIAYDDLREWLVLAERLGEVRTVRGASWQEDIGLAAQAILRAENGPCVVFEDIPGCAKGFRLLLNMFAGTRRIAPCCAPPRSSRT